MLDCTCIFSSNHQAIRKRIKGQTTNLQSITQKIKDRATRTPLKMGVNLSVQLYILARKTISVFRYLSSGLI
jgi:hypothetical protein